MGTAGTRCCSTGRRSASTYRHSSGPPSTATTRTRRSWSSRPTNMTGTTTSANTVCSWGSEPVRRIGHVISDLLEIVVCPGCRAHPLREHRFSAEDGVLACSNCGRWYPIEDGLLELLLEPLSY